MKATVIFNDVKFIHEVDYEEKQTTLTDSYLNRVYTHNGIIRNFYIIHEIMQKVFGQY